MIDRLQRDDMYTQWGIRTLSEAAARYNPMSYHNGSVWPHDTALVGAGFARYGHKADAGELLGNLFGVSLYYGAHVCRNCSAASADAMATVRHTILLPARRRPGRLARPSCC